MNRCAVCGWPLRESASDGCVRGNCSQRPFPDRAYDPERYRHEYDHDDHSVAPKASPEPRYRITGLDNIDWYMRDWKQMTNFLDTKLLYAAEELEVGETLNIQIDRIEISDDKLDELITEEDP